MKQPLIIPELEIKDFDGFVNLNNYRWLDQQINDFQYSHRRILPSIIVNGKNYSYPVINDRGEIIFKNKNGQIILGYKN